MSLINTTIWATVSMSTIKATPIWKEMAKKHGGKIPHEYHNTTLRAALVMLGMSTDGHYTVERGVNIRSNNNRRVVFANTTLYTFPVRQDYKYKRIYQGVDILHFGEEDFTGWGSSHIKMEDFGNEHDPSRDDDSEF
ncbi:hypothetical protein JR318_gp167 [Escherichia phage vB_vPM_PD06]|uniref:Phi92_gp077 n=7 Tax=Justusliebigvirus TaxID=2948775 RepID=I7HTA8_9CAUD|nr:Phi92_gp077 [Escherichia phage phi92]YP_009984439.1 hypothetical protein JR317_gp071 [Escherichia phage vB_EcoM_PHB05]YP_009984766.1 hypothetical protein JR318_gp167 [Escherichia phage vB_vPM_PD06]YP_009985305.1 hypothetical protein JR320_gp202 [Escherichia phage alia]YP_009985660.1 hypothetical protein JR322_gp203 [Escherichia phage muut]YP_009987281.1 hypothetical protein JR328_gp072 [Escherichia phage VEcB]AXY81437.1 hypothetical protein [Escherichia phage vB_vPM_PD114]EHO4365565.1 hyp